jgi:crotonobetainyl-CoA:carnitine CoA-transferase CaiB-like acyl-CoA transferase
VSEGPLRGTLVVELGNLIAAPFAAMLLADLGARVVKVEPVDGDLSRRFGPYQEGESLFFMTVNRGKESLALDTHDWVSKRVLDNLVRKADVLVNNLRQGAMDRLGLDEHNCRQLNPTLIYASINAFGATGPYAGRSGVDVVFQGESGMISITGDAKDGPHKTATTIADYLAGTNTALAISAALAEQPRRWRTIDVSLRDGLMAVQSGWNALAMASGAQPERTGTASPFLTPNQVFHGSDGPFTLAIVSDRHFELLADALERPDLVEDYPTNETRTSRRPELIRKLDRVFKTQESEHWITLLGQAGLPTGHVLGLAEALSDPQARHHEMVVGLDHPVAGEIRVTGSPTRLDDDPALARVAPPTLGQHTRPLLRELGVDPESIERMITEGRAVAS